MISSAPSRTSSSERSSVRRATELSIARSARSASNALSALTSACLSQPVVSRATLTADEIDSPASSASRRAVTSTYV
jgi:hypothetical protein